MKLIGGLGQEHCTRAVVNTHLLKEMSLFWELGYWVFFFLSCILLKGNVIERGRE